jgi:hypothetical protein
VPYEFLSPEWIEAARTLRNEIGDLGPAPVVVVINLDVNNAPFSTSTLMAHLNTSSGPLAIDEGHHPSPDLSVVIEWETAKALLIEGNPQAVMSAFMAGKIRVEGDMSKLVALQNVSPDERAHEAVAKLRALTA